MRLALLFFLLLIPASNAIPFLAARAAMEPGGAIGDSTAEPLVEKDQKRLNESAVQEAAVTTVSLGVQGKNTKNNIVSAPVQHNMEGLWQVLLTSLKIGNYNLASRNFAVLSTLTDKIIVPESVFGSIVRAVQARFDSRLGSYTVDCGLQAQLQIGIQFEAIALATHTFIQPRDGLCILNIRPHKRPTYVIGAGAFVDNGVCMDFFHSVGTFFRPPKLEKLSGQSSEGIRITKESINFKRMIILK